VKLDFSAAVISRWREAGIPAAIEASTLTALLRIFFFASLPEEEVGEGYAEAMAFVCRAAAAGPGRIRLPSLLLGMLLSSVFFTLFLPVLELLGLWGHSLLILLPTGAALRLLIPAAAVFALILEGLFLLLLVRALNRAKKLPLVFYLFGE
jgi:hypothetical protein